MSEDQSFHIFVGLKRILIPEENNDEPGEHQQVKGGQYYWFLNWYDEKAAEASETEPYWTAKASQKELLEFALKKCSQLDPKLAEIILKSKPADIRIPPLILRDVAMTEMPSSRVTLMGDAAHAMMPCKSPSPRL